jgi:hypothetical protein
MDMLPTSECFRAALRGVEAVEVHLIRIKLSDAGFFSKSLATSCAVSCRLGQVSMTVLAMAFKAFLSAALGNGRVSVGFMGTRSLR